MTTERIFTQAELVRKLHDLRAANPAIRIGFTNGTFSLPHAGHFHLIREAKKKCDFLIVAMNSRASIEALDRGHEKLKDDASRMQLLAKKTPADAVITFDEPTAVGLIETLMPSVLFKGDEPHVRDLIFPEAHAIKEMGGDVELLPTHQKGWLSASSLAKKTPGTKTK